METISECIDFVFMLSTLSKRSEHGGSGLGEQ